MARSKSWLTSEIEWKRKTCALQFRKRRDAECDTHNYRVGAKSKYIISVIIPATNDVIQKSVVSTTVIIKFIIQNITTRHTFSRCMTKNNKSKVKQREWNFLGHTRQFPRWPLKHHSPPHSCRFLAYLANTLLWAESYCSRASESAKFDLSQEAGFSWGPELLHLLTWSSYHAPAHISFRRRSPYILQ
jgi:hypothetical protein